MGGRAVYGGGRRRARAALLVVIAAASLLGPGAAPAAAQTPSQAVVAARANAGNNGVTSFISVVDRNTGAVLGQTSNAGAQVASESIMKLFLATYYLWSYGGYSQTPQSVKDRLSYMLRYSDDDTASALFTASAIPTVAANYGLGSTGNATDRVGHWGAARITASDMTRFLFRASKDPKVGPWLIPVMAQTARTGSGADAGFSQYFGLNALSGVHGSKQGWGCDSYWTAPQCAVHSVGYTDRYFVAVLQLGGYPDPTRSTATTSARLIQSSGTPLANGDFVCDSVSGAVYRLVGGAPLYVSTWSVFGGSKPCRSMSPAAIGRLPRFPADGTFIRDPTAGAIYRVAGGAPIYVYRWASFPGLQRVTDVDHASIANADRGGVWNHLHRFPVDGTFIRGTTEGAVYRVAGGAPIYVNSWASFPGTHLVTGVDSAALSRAGSGGVWSHLRSVPIDGTFVGGSRDGSIFRIAGGAPIYVSTWAAFGGAKPFVVVDSSAIDRAGAGGIWNHLLRYPLDGTLLRGTSSGAVFRVAGGAPLYLTSWSVFGGERPTVNVDYAATTRAATGGAYNHLRKTPVDGTFLQGLPGGRIYRVIGGAAIYVPSWEPFGGPKEYTSLTQPTIDRAGSGGDYNHLLGVH